MKEHKFKGWDKEHNRWASSATTIIKRYHILLPNVELVEYTGLHDKNGVEIYEGDILDNGRVKFVARWDEDGYYYAEVINDKKWIPEHAKLCHYGNAWEVIGNIYENKELLE